MEMDGDLIELPLVDLLEKFGSGGHKPGSGSAAALQGLVSCHLLRTVISLTTEDKRKDKYGDVWSELESIDELIKKDIEPALMEAFQKDAAQFDRVIEAREKRDDAKSQKQRWEFERQALQELLRATHIPFDIAENCLELATHAIRVFEIGFQSARGDSEVAIGAALSGADGAIAIVHLNLISFQGEEEIKALLKRANELQQRARHLQSEHQSCCEELKSKAEEINDKFHIKLEKLRNPKLVGSRLDFDQIEEIAEIIQNELWVKRKDVWNGRNFESPLDVLQPDAAFVSLRYQFELRNFLGQEPDSDGSVYEIAGHINKPEKYVVISDQFEPEVIRFTAAHELGHALLHDIDTAHRDRGLDGSSISSRDPMEVEADKFAVYFLMPSEYVINEFEDRFESIPFSITEDTAHRLSEGSPNKLKENHQTLRSFSIRLAKETSYNGVNFDSLATYFGVSNEAMAIRLEELGLIDWQNESAT